MHGDDEYLESKVMTASPYHLHLLVVDGAIRHASRAEAALEEGDFEAAHFALNDSRGFLGELIGGLKEDEAPELVGPLKVMFLFVFRSLVEADMHRDANKVRDALKILHMHRETWLALAGALDGGQQTEAGGPPRPHITAAPAEAAETGRSWVS